MAAPVYWIYPSFIVRLRADWNVFLSCPLILLMVYVPAVRINVYFYHAKNRVWRL